jgi:hypothetical protein
MLWSDAVLLNKVLYLLAVAMLLFGIGTAFLATRPTMGKRAEILWAVTITCITAASAYLTAALVFNWY